MGDNDSTGYWRTRLAGAIAVELEPDALRLTAREHRAAVEETTLPGDVAALLDTMGETTGVASSLVVLATLAVVLHRHTGASDLLVGLDPRTLGDTAVVADLLPVRVELDPDAAFSDVILRIHQTVVDAIAHAGELREGDLAVDAAEGGAHPLVRVAVIGSYEDSPVASSELDIVLGLDRRNGTTTLTLRYDRSLLGRSTADWLLGHCSTLLAEALRCPGLPVRVLRIQDRSVPVPAWTAAPPRGFVPPTPVTGRESLLDRFRSVVAEHGDRLAVSGPSGSFLYKHLDSVTTGIAHRLSTAAGLGKRLALLCEHDVGVAVGIWSVLKSGAAYVPLDPRQPDGRLARNVADTDVTAIVCDPGLVDRASVLARGRPVVPLNPADAEAGPLPPVGPDALAYLLSTSGSTGRPKAVMQNHRNVLAHAITYAGRVRIVPEDRVPLLARYGFDAAVMDFFGALLTGASLHVIDSMLPPVSLRGRLADVAASFVHCTPTLFRHLVSDLGEVGNGRVETLASVRMVVLGGEEATRQDLRRFFAAFPMDSALVNGLGPTECTLALQYLASRADLTASTLPVGYSVDGVQVRLLDRDGRVTEVFGELEIISERVALGYWRQPETTAAVFGAYEDGTRFYRTGDLARRRPDGALVFCGRKDRQVKIRGHRVEPGEIEAMLRSHPTVAQAALIVRDGSAGPRLIAYVTPATAFPPDADELTRYLRRILPDYAMPWRIVVLDGMPVGPTGKLDRSKLPAPDEAADGVDDRPQTPVEQAVARIWCRILGVPAAGLRTNFIASGGDSILMLEMLRTVHDELAVDVPPVEFLKAPTVATMAGIVEREQAC